MIFRIESDVIPVDCVVGTVIAAGERSPIVDLERSGKLGVGEKIPHGQ